MTMIADVVTGETGTADVLFLAAFVCALLSALASAVGERFAGPLLSAAVGAVALGLLVL